MKSYTETEVADPELVQAFLIAQDAFSKFPAKYEGDWVRCHEVARAVLELLRRKRQWAHTNLDVVDGYYGAMPHSWIDAGEHGILDTYCVARMPAVQLIVRTHVTSHFERIYVPSTLRQLRVKLRPKVVEHLVAIGL